MPLVDTRDEDGRDLNDVRENVLYTPQPKGTPHTDRATVSHGLHADRND